MQEYPLLKNVIDWIHVFHKPNFLWYEFTVVKLNQSGTAKPVHDRINDMTIKTKANGVETLLNANIKLRKTEYKDILIISVLMKLKLFKEAEQELKQFENFEKPEK